MRILAIGDIHGCRVSLEAMAEYAGFAQGDTIVTLGDYVDRGPDSKGVIDFLISLQDKLTLIPLKGNHELVMLRSRADVEALKNWKGEAFGGTATLDSYGTDSISDIPEKHWSFLESARAYYEINSHFFVHANVDPALAMVDQGNYTLFWEFFENPAPHESGKVMLCGHSEVGEHPKNLGHAVCLDTGACKGGWLTCLDVGKGIYYQTNEQGESRRDVLLSHLETKDSSHEL